MNRIIAIEGVQGAGKSTLAKKLSHHYDIPIYACDDRIRYGKLMEAWNTGITDLTVLDFILKSKGTTVIFDRILPSNFVYKKEYDPSILEWWRHFHGLIPMKFIYLWGDNSFDRAKKRFEGYSLISIEDKKELLNRYEIVLGDMDSSSYYRINSTINDSDEVLDLAIKYIGE